MKKTPKLATFMALTLLGGCIPSVGPVAIENNTPFPGLANLLAALPPNGSLNIFVAHGINEESDDYEKPLQSSIANNLNLGTPDDLKQMYLGISQPDIELDGASVWPTYPGYSWECTGGAKLDTCEAPYLDVRIYHTKDNKEVAFYSLNYWGMLVWLKCSQLVPVDTKLTGDLTAFGTGNAAYCNTRFSGRPGFQPIPTQAVSNAPVILDHVIKNDILSWGFADAVIAISGYRQVLHQAVQKALEIESVDVGARQIFKQAHRLRPTMEQEAADRLTYKDAFLHPTVPQAYAIITESLGSYVVLDTLAWAAPQDTAGAEGASIICRASQIHMLANQVSLLRLSRTRAVLPSKTTADGDIRGQGSAPADPTNCTSEYGPPYIMGYHDPSDLLTFYLPHPPPGARHSFEAQLDARMINVVAPFAQQVIPFVLVNPTEAHTEGQEIDPRIQAMVSFGSDGHQPNQQPTAFDGTPPRPASR